MEQTELVGSLVSAPPIEGRTWRKGTLHLPNISDGQAMQGSTVLMHWNWTRDGGEVLAISFETSEAGTQTAYLAPGDVAALRGFFSDTAKLTT